MSTRVLAALALAALVAPATAAEWRPAAHASDRTLELRTQAAGERPHWFRVWLAVIDGQVYVRLGPRAARRVEENVRKPYLGVRLGGVQFDRVRGEPAPEMAARVGEEMRRKYWTDVLVRHMSHPLVLRLVPE
ncbi:MAG TPA: hypothetical protein VFD84_16835 [Candidatus Binatia bacterium]|jgi:hypothetical protein|nr:hypothetical protein [Candidatus Binatia bacterium]